MSTQQKIHNSDQITDFYNYHLESFGTSAQGVGWKNDQAQNIRFEQLTKIFNGNHVFTINDLGCGIGTYLPFLKSRGYLPNRYNGYDILETMIIAAKRYLPSDEKIKLTKIDSPEEMEVADYSVASGIFNIKYQISEADWLGNVLSTLESMNHKSIQGFAFNLLTKYSDPEFMQSYLYYADPLFLFDFCKRNFSRNVALLHDYGQFDFTILVRKESINQ